MLGLKICVLYGMEKGYDLIHTVEPKVYEPRLLALYAGTGASAASAIRHYFSDPKFTGRVLVNPEYPQHVSMVTLDPVFELGQLLEEGMLAPFIHFGGQIAGRMDCDLPPGFGSNLFTDFMICLTLQRQEWKGVIEFDCRPPRTTTTVQGLINFLNGAVGYWETLEGKVADYFKDDQIAELEGALTEEDGHTMDNLLVASGMMNTPVIIKEVDALRANFKGFTAAAGVNTDVIEAYQRRVRQIITGNAKRTVLPAPATQPNPEDTWPAMSGKVAPATETAADILAKIPTGHEQAEPETGAPPATIPKAPGPTALRPVLAQSAADLPR